MKLRNLLGYEGFYAADKEGNIYRTERYGRRICRKIALRLKRHGYLSAHLCVDAIRTDVPVHRAVWQAFNGAIPPGLEMNHINGIKTDNSLTNLELCTKSQNVRHRFRVLGHKPPNNPNPGERNGSAKLTDASVRRIRLLHAEGMTQKEIGSIFGVSQVMVGKIVRRDNWRHIKPD